MVAFSTIALLWVLSAGLLTATDAASADNTTLAPTAAPPSYYSSSSSYSVVDPVGTKYTTKKSSASIIISQNDQDKENCLGTAMSFSVTAQALTTLFEGDTNVMPSVSAYVSYDSTTLRQCADGEAGSSTMVFNSTSSGYDNVPTGCCSDHVGLWGDAGTYYPTISSGSAAAGSGGTSPTDSSFHQGSGAPGPAQSPPDLQVTGSGATFSATLSSTILLYDEMLAMSSGSTSAGGGGAAGMTKDGKCVIDIVTACAGTVIVDGGQHSKRCTAKGCTKSTVDDEKEFCATAEDLGGATATGTIKIPKLNVKFDLANLPEGAKLRVRAGKSKSDHETVVV
ncbi:hypothetical protein JKP88DRAFT_274749 [Tribonema minus]|uniref:Uncharacterized protein n=1 Tax=Tribonema minus TaxID=303371 RepID=A0A835ZIJ7_9STRA|nr:hypothetical protein JKP88DRAFT_274749 [Tribonema minus]